MYLETCGHGLLFSLSETDEVEGIVLGRSTSSERPDEHRHVVSVESNVVALVERQ
jgi:hypothetical protein